MEIIPDQLWEAAKAAGWFGTAFTLFMWWLERGERRDWQTRYIELSERSMTATHASATAIQSLKDLIITSSATRRE